MTIRNITAAATTGMIYLSSISPVLAITLDTTRTDVPGYSSTVNGDSIIPFIFRVLIIVGAIALLIFLLWGAIQWIISGGDKDKIKAARGTIINALIGFAVLALAFAIANFVGNIVGFDPTQSFTIEGIR